MGKKILLADDSITIQKVIELTFSDEDFEVVTVGNGRLAIEKAQEMRPDVVLCDIIMPEKDGYEVCEFIKKHAPLAGVPVLLLTGAFEPFDQERADMVGADGFLAKPFEPQTLVAKVKDLLSKAASRSATTQAVSTPPALAEETAEVAEEVAGQAEPAGHAETAPASFADALDDEAAATAEAVEEDWGGAGSPAAPEEVPAFAAGDEALPAGDDMLPAEEATPAVDEDFVTPEGGGAPPDAPEDEMAGLSAAEEASLASPASAESVPPVSEPQFEAIDDEAEPAAAEEQPVAAPLHEFDDEFEAVPPETPPAFPQRPSLELSLEERARAAASSPTEEAPAFDAAAAEIPGAEAPAGSPFDALDEESAEVGEPAQESGASPVREPEAASPVEKAPEPEAIGSFAEVVPPEPEPEPSQAAQVAVPAEMVAQIAQRVVAQISDKVIREVAWEVIPDLAEALIKKEIERLRDEQRKL